MATAAFQLPLQRHRNQRLFSDHYLNEILPERPEWLALAGEAGAALAEVRAIWRAFRPSANEAQTEHELIRPVLAALGHVFEVQPALATPDGTKRPDYVLYRDGAALAANKNQTLTEALLQAGGLAVADAKAWDRPLDVAVKTAGGDPFTNKTPGWQIFFYLLHSGLAWGILTNGRLWRLYHRASAHRLDHYYEVDLPALLETDDPRAFLYFHAFFRRAAFEPGPLGLAALLAASASHTRAVGDTLKAQIFDALRHLAQGFLDYAPNGLASDPATLRVIYDNSLIVLYRLLFVLYAEARDLLPLRENPLYRDRYSLAAIIKDVADDLRFGIRLLPGSATLWSRLQALVHVIDTGSPALNVSTFNGGLFDPARHPFLERYAVGDGHLQQALDRLARVNGEAVDYRDLAVRHLGTIYEGLLEYQLATIPPEGGWTIDLVNDKGERKVSGSYYTPDYIVEHIVDQTVGPMLRAAIADGETEAEKIQAVLDVNVLDPAMGSGHFLVEATEYIARFLVDQAITPGADRAAESDLAYWKRRVAQSCVYGVDLNPLAVDLAKLSLWLATVAKDRPLSFLDHHLRTGNALVGARLDDLRLTTPEAPAKRRAAKTAPPAEQLALLDEDSFRVQMRGAVARMWTIEETAGATIEEVKEQERVHDELRQMVTRRYGRLADLVTAQHFGLSIPPDPALWQGLADYATGRAVAATAREYPAWLEEAETLAERHRFFHWELEFPEVFFDRHGQSLGPAAGFDAVIGNPPYVRQEQVSAFKPYFAAAHAPVYHGVADLYVYFYRQGLELLQRGGRLSYIVTNKWLRAGYGEPLRGYFAERAAIEQIVDFGHAPIFPDADTFPCILVARKRGENEPEDGADQTRIALFPREALGRVTVPAYVEEHGYPVPSRRFTSQPWSLERAEVDDLMAKIRRAGVPLTEFTGVKPYRGVLTGLNEAFLIDTPTRDRLVSADPRSAEIVKPYLRGQDIKRWTPEWAGLWLILLKSSGDHAWPWSSAGEGAEDVFAQTYPALHAHLKPMEAKLRKRQDKGRHWWELRSCAYYSLFEQSKLMYQEIQFHSAYSYDTQGFLCNNKGFFLPAGDRYLLAVLTSPLMWWHNWRYLPHMKDEALSPVGDLMVSLPIAPATDAIRTEADQAVTRLTALTGKRRAASAEMLDWLRVEFEVAAPGQRLEGFAALAEDAFIEEVRRVRPRAAGRLTPAALRDLRAAFGQSAPAVRALEAESQTLERRLSDLVNAAYGLTPEEVDLMWRTAPPRMPVGAPG